MRQLLFVLFTLLIILICCSCGTEEPANHGEQISQLAYTNGCSSIYGFMV